jgi:two-component system cell cycle sensor histidine kinase/response regulator CckA
MSRQPARHTLRSSMMGLGITAVIYVAVLGLLVILTIRPSSDRLRSSSQSVLDEYRESTVRAQTMDHTATDLWRLHGGMADRVISLDTLEGLRRRIERLAETSNATLRLSSTDAASALQTILASATVFEEQLRVALLGAIASMQLGDRTAAQNMLRRADSLRTPLSESLNDATAIALREVAAHEENLDDAMTALNAVIVVWLIGGLLALPMFAYFLRRRLDAPLAVLDGALDRVSAGDFDVHIEPDRPDEIGRLVDQFNRMAVMLRQRSVEDAQRAEDRTAARTRLILDAALDAVVVADGAGRIKEWSPYAEQVFGWTRAEVMDRTVAETIIPVEFREAHTVGLERFQKTGHGPFMNRRLELVALRKDGTRFPVEITITPLQGKQTEFSAFIRDITERRRAEIALSESEARYRAAFEQAGVGMVEVDLEGKYLRVNPAFAELVGRQADDILGKRLSDLAHPEDAAADDLAFKRLTAGGLPVRRQKRYLRPDGNVAVANITAAIVRDSSGVPLYVLTVVQDVTAQRRLEEELRQAHKMDAVGQLAGGIAHDFNNLLTAIIGYADLLRVSQGSSQEVKEDAAAILATAARGAELARNLLTLARTAPARDEPVDVHQAINEVRDIAARTFDRRIAVELNLAAARSVVTGDRSLLTNALLNLALNARDAMPDGGVLTFSTLEKRLDQEECDRLAGVIEPGPFLIVRVDDTGSGMAPNVQRRAFEPFFTNKPAGKGTGIGLSMVYGTVRSHSGAIELKSAVGAGTAFTIYLPLRLLAADEMEASTPELVTGTGLILLADDDSVVRDVARRMLRQLGYQVEIAVDGADAVERIAAEPRRFDLVILDGNMPRMHGRDAAVLIRELAPHLRLILSTGYLEPGDSDRLATYGFSAAIGKPYSMSELSRVVAQHMGPPKTPVSEIAATAD